MRKCVGVLLLIAAAILSANSAALAEIDLCQAVAVRDLAEQPADDNHPVLKAVKRGDIYQAISQYTVSKTTKLASICSHGGGCVPAQVIENGRKVEIWQLTNCKIGKSSYQDADETIYELILDRSKVAPASLKRMDVDDKLLQLGLCNACADNATELYLTKPASRCGQLVKRALAGNAGAVSALKADPPYCTAGK